MKYCPNCRIELSDTAKFCQSCGGILAESGNISRCPRCGLDVRPKWKFCKQCGSPLPTEVPRAVETGTISCTNCGTANHTGTKFCKRCGKPLATIAATSVAAAAASAPLAPHPVMPTSFAEPTLPTAPAREPTRITEPEQAPAPAEVTPLGVECPKCGSRVPVGLKFCDTCGTPLLPVEKRTPAMPTEVHPTLKKKVLICTGIAFVVLLAAGTGWYFWGVQLTIVSEPPAAQVYVDSQLIGKTSEADGTLKLAHVRRGQHSVKLEREGYAAWTQPVQLGISEFRHTTHATLTVESFTLSVVSVPPGSRLMLDGKDAGTTDVADGKLTLTGVSKGQHSLVIQHEGLPDWTQEVSVDGEKEIRAELGVAAAPAQGATTADYHLSQANRLFTEGQYRPAIAECDAALQVDPANRAAAELKAKIQKTMQILGVKEPAGGEPPAAEDGAALYKAHCAACHKTDASGNPAIKAPAVKGKSAADITKAMENPKHAAAKKKVNEAQIKAIGDYLAEILGVKEPAGGEPPPARPVSQIVGEWRGTFKHTMATRHDEHDMTFEIRQLTNGAYAGRVIGFIENGSSAMSDISFDGVHLHFVDAAGRHYAGIVDGDSIIGKESWGRDAVPFGTFRMTKR